MKIIKYIKIQEIQDIFITARMIFVQIFVINFNDAAKSNQFDLMILRSPFTCFVDEQILTCVQISWIIDYF